ncbi:hypothetical protein LZ395_03770 [Levilactobacillus zymae]|nr:hypothetical protein LZ395_03770 [Levilactobacillus zymae]
MCWWGSSRQHHDRCQVTGNDHGYVRKTRNQERHLGSAKVHAIQGQEDGQEYRSLR